MTEAVVNGKETRCLVINNGDDLLTLKKVVSKKSDKDEAEKQKNNITKKMNGSELNGNPNKTDSINFDVDNTSSLEPNLEMDSDTDRNITIDDSVCTQEDRELENIDVSNDNSNETKNDDKDNEAVAVQNSSIEYSPSNSSSDTEYSCDLEDYNLENVQSPSLTTSYHNVSSRAPLHNNTDDFDSTLEEEIKPLTSHILVNEKKRKIENNLEEERKSYKILKLWDIMKYPFQKITTGSVIRENQSSNISKAEDLTDKESPAVLETVTDDSSSETEELNESITTDTKAEVQETSESAVNKQTNCSIM